jgi:L-lactate dehydrogenase complex protein LldG
MSDARAEMLDRIASAIAGATSVDVPRAYRRRGTLDPAETIDRFCERVDDYRAEVRRVNAMEIESVVQELCAERGLSRLAIPPELPWRPAGVELVEDHGLSARELDGVDGAFTGCSAAVAETGTIVLTGGEYEGRRALTLVPDLHICVVRESQVCELLPEALEQLEPTRPITFVSGPSATSDIELSRVEGVHGPRTLVVLVAKEAS